MLVLSLALAIAAQPSLSAQIDEIIKPELDAGSLIGVVIMRPDGTELYTHMAGTRMVPASNQKILTAIHAFDKLGSDYKFTTKFWRDSDNVWIDAPGDLTITADQLKNIKIQLGVSGSGTVYVRQAYRHSAGPSWEIDDAPFRYAPAITALCVDRAQFIVGNSGGVPTVPDWTGIQVRHIAGLLPSTTDFNRTKSLVTIRGKIDPKAANLGVFALPDPDRSAARIFGRGYQTTTQTPNRPPDAIIVSPSIREIAKLCLEPSDNLLAESLLLGATSSSSYTAAQRAMTEHFYTLPGIIRGSLRPDDGSGLSRHNLVSPMTVAQLLRHAYSQPYRDDFIRALPASGEGTMRSRLAGMRVTAKTGTLDAVSCLSGYAWSNTGEPVIFAVMMNHHVFPSAQARKMQDTIVETVLKSLDSVRFDYGNANWCAPLEEDVPNSRFIPAHGDRLY